MAPNLFALYETDTSTEAEYQSAHTAECCNDVPAPAYPPEVSRSLLHLEPQPSLDQCLSPAARHQLFT